MSITCPVFPNRIGAGDGSRHALAPNTRRRPPTPRPRRASITGTARATVYVPNCRSNKASPGAACPPRPPVYVRWPHASAPGGSRPNARRTPAPPPPPPLLEPPHQRRGMSTRHGCLPLQGFDQHGVGRNSPQAGEVVTEHQIQFSGGFGGQPGKTRSDDDLKLTGSLDIRHADPQQKGHRAHRKGEEHEPPFQSPPAPLDAVCHGRIAEFTALRTGIAAERSSPGLPGWKR